MPITVEPGLALNYLGNHPDIKFDYISSTSGHYVISLKTLTNRWQDVLSSLASGSTVSVEKTDESVSTQWHVIQNQDYNIWFKTGQLRFLTGGDGDRKLKNLNSEHFLAATIGSNNLQKIQYTDQRPYQFLFTNRKVRPHRRYLILKLKELGLLEHALWSCLNQYNTWGHPDFNRVYAEGSSMPLKTLDPGYDPEVKPDWIDGVIYPRQFQDSWFSLVSETGFEYPHSFRTEKIYKPILAGHPFVVCANAGFYRDLHNQGFRTFGHLIDESFDAIIDGKDRLDRIVETVQWLCSQDLSLFWNQAQEVCLYNQQRAYELHNSQRENFTQQLIDFMYA